MNAFYKVKVIEFERGWGTKVDSTEYFRSKVLAENWVKRFNSKKMALVVPDWHIKAYAPKQVTDHKAVAVLQKWFEKYPNRSRASTDNKEFLDFKANIGASV